MTRPAVTGKLLMAMYRAMRERFGHQNWWPGETRLEVCVGAILTQNTNWRNVEKAIANLVSAGCMDIGELNSITHARLAGLIRPAGYFNVKSKRVKNFIARVWADFAGDLDAFLDRPVGRLRDDLLSVNGIGPETADSIVLYAAGLAGFVVDAYTRRVLLRHGLIEEGDDYEAVKSLFERLLKRDVELWNDYHAQLVAVGKDFCRPKARCEGCPLSPFEHDPDAC